MVERHNCHHGELELHVKKLNIGSGCVKGSVFAEGWTNVDLAAFEEPKDRWEGTDYLNFDIKGTWALPANSIDCIFASHIFEHIEYEKQRKVYEEAHRVLMPGGPIRIICPDPRKFIRNWQAKNMVFIKDCYGQDNIDKYEYASNPAMAFTDMFYTDHYDHLLVPSIDMVSIMLIRAGFSKVTEMGYTNTEFPQFFGDYEHTIDNRPVMSWYLEAVK